MKRKHSTQHLRADAVCFGFAIDRCPHLAEMRELLRAQRFSGLEVADQLAKIVAELPVACPVTAVAYMSTST